MDIVKLTHTTETKKPTLNPSLPSHEKSLPADSVEITGNSANDSSQPISFGGMLMAFRSDDKPAPEAPKNVDVMGEMDKLITQQRRQEAEMNLQRMAERHQDMFRQTLSLIG